MHPRDLSAHVEYRAGRGIEEVARELGRDPEDFVVLSSNENPHGPAPAAIEAVREAAPEVHRYPKSAHTDLAERLAAEWDLEPAQVWLGNGGDAALDYVARATLDPGDRVLVPQPGFSYYAMSARYHHGVVDEYHLEKDEGFTITPDRVLEAYDGHRVVYLTSPNNPTGGTVDPADVHEVADRTDDETLVLLDEAYAEYADTRTMIPDVDERDDLAVLRTFSKVYGLAGLRLGYVVAPPAWADAYASVNTPFSASEVACRAGLAALDDDAHVERAVETARWGRGYLARELPAPTYESEGNFVLVDVAGADAGDHETPAAAVVAAAQQRGVILRDCTSFGLPACVRVTVGTRAETERAATVLSEVLGA